jgi:enterochelin esterase-like enzyme
MQNTRFSRWAAGTLWTSFLMLILAVAIAPAQNPSPAPNDTLHSVVVNGDGTVTFSYFDPRADSVKLGPPDLPEDARKAPMKREPNGVWTITVGPIAPGAYRYSFVVNTLNVTDPHNPSVSEANMNPWSLMYIPGADFMDVKNVPHGSVAEVTYYSTSLNRFRRMHVYTPPGYESGEGKYPVFYLLHGAWDADDAWSTIGRAGFILDNLIAQHKAVPMIVVMPAGHTGPFPPLTQQPSPRRDEFADDFLTDVKPYVEKNYRVVNDRNHRAIAGLSMGGSQTLNIAIPHLNDYAYVGVFSSGVLELQGHGLFERDANQPVWEDRNGKFLDDAKAKSGLKLLWFATGKDDFLLGVSRQTVEMLKKHGFRVELDATSGAHTWTNWREYLVQFAPRLFR